MATPLLEAREKQILLYLPCGLSKEQVGDKLDVSKATVKGDLGRIYEKMKTNYLPAVVLLAVLKGEISLDEYRCMFIQLGWL